MSPVAGSGRDRAGRARDADQAAEAKRRAKAAAQEAKAAKRDAKAAKGRFAGEPEPVPRSQRARRAAIAGTLADMDGRGLFRFDVAATVLFAAVTLLVSVVDTDATNLLNIVVSSVLFLVSCGIFVAGFLIAAGRSRDEHLHLAGLYYLTGSAPDAVRRAFLRLWFLQIGIGIVAIFTTRPPFGVMATFLGVAVNSLWAARHGRFEPIEA